MQCCGFCENGGALVEVETHLRVGFGNSNERGEGSDRGKILSLRENNNMRRFVC